MAFLAIVNCVFLFVQSLRALNIWQLSGYTFDGSAKLKEDFLSQIMYGGLNAVVCYFCYLTAVSLQAWWISVFYIVYCLASALQYYFAHKPKCVRTPIVFTKRCIRFCIAYFVVTAILCTVAYLGGNALEAGGIRLCFAFIPLLYLFSPLIFFLSAVAVKPVEQAVARKYINGCKKVLDAKADLIRIGITGSYGKTGVKNILAAMLGERYRVFATPASFNTPMGICRSVNDMPADTQIFIAEMGAKRKGDISQLCDITQPEAAVITGIAAQHLATFGSLQNIMDTKAELCEFVASRGGFCVFNTDNDYCKLMYRQCKGEKYCTGMYGECYAKNVKADSEGSSFILCFKDGQSVECRTKLLGLHNVSNIVVAAAVAVKYGIEPNEIARAVGKLKPVPHRLELSVNGAGITIIDDGYNSNESGAQAALDTLAMFEGRKIVACQGLVEMGDRQSRANFELGRKIAEVADLAVLIGPNADDMRQGMLSVGYNGQRITVVSDIVKAQNVFAQILKKGDVLLIENDLPDSF